MKIAAFVFSILILSSTAFAQKKSSGAEAPDMPIDTITKLVTYTGVVEYPGTPKMELYKRAMKWIKQYYPNPVGVIQEQDSVNGKIVGRAQFYVHKTLKDGSKVNADMMIYNITFLFKDGKYKYEISKINIKGPSTVPVEKYFDETSPEHEAHFNALTEADETFTLMVDNLKARMAKPSADAKKSDW